MPRSRFVQKGGTLEPVQKVPTFRYTVNEGRKAWTSALYPYAPYFFNIVKEIPWDDFQYEDGRVSVRCNSYGGYRFFGGSAFELWDKEYSSELTNKRLHKIVDPTGDIDVILIPPIVSSKGGKLADEDYRFIRDTRGTWNPWANAYTDWLIHHIELFLRSLSYNYKEWLPTLIHFESNPERYTDALIANSEAKYAVQTPVFIGPFALYKTNQPDEEFNGTKIQVSAAVEYGDGQVYFDHFMEFICRGQEGAEEDAPFPYLDLPTLQLTTRPLAEELFENYYALMERVQFMNNPPLQHKFFNHVTRAVFILHLFSRVFIEDATEEYRNKIFRYYFMHEKFIDRSIPYYDNLTMVLQILKQNETKEYKAWHESILAGYLGGARKKRRQTKKKCRTRTARK